MAQNENPNELDHVAGAGERWLIYLGSEGAWHWQFEQSPGKIFAYSATRFPTREEAIANATRYGYPSAITVERTANQPPGVKWIA